MRFSIAAGFKRLETVRKWGKDAEAEEQGMEMAKKRRTGVKFRGGEKL